MKKILWILIFAISVLMLVVFTTSRFTDSFIYENGIEYNEFPEDEIVVEDESDVNYSSAPAVKNYFSVVLGYIKEILTIISMIFSIIMVFRKK